MWIKNFLRNKFFFLLLVSFGSIFFARSFFNIDTDFGWQLATGNYILTHGIPQTEPFSYTMPSYSYIDHEWLFQVLISVLYSRVGYFGLSVLFTFIPVAILLVLYKKYGSHALLPILLLANVFLLRVGIRAEIITWLLFFLFFLFLQYQTFHRRYLFLVPLLFLFWVNVHGSFILPLCLWGIVLLDRFFHKRLIRSEVLGFILSVSVTFFTPYGYFMWREVLHQLIDLLTPSGTAEWSRSYLYAESVYLFVIIILSILLYIFLKKLSLSTICISVILALSSLFTIRLVPIFSLWVAFILPSMLTLLQEYLERLDYGFARFIIFSRIIIIVVVIFTSIEFISSIINLFKFSVDKYYPVGAIEFMRLNAANPRIFSLYEWGGFLVWQYPEHKVFITGMMPTFRWKAPVAESSYAYGDYKWILRGERVKELFSKFGIRTVLIRSNDPSLDRLRAYLYAHEWILLYSDSVSEVFVENTFVES